MARSSRRGQRDAVAEEGQGCLQFQIVRAMAVEDWKKERRLARKLKALDKPPSVDLDPTARLLAQQAQAGGGISWGPATVQVRRAAPGG